MGDCYIKLRGGTRKYIYKSGVGLSAGVTGFISSDSGGSVVVGSDKITATIPSKDNNKETFLTAQAVDATYYKTLVFEGVTAWWEGSGAYSHGLGLQAGNLTEVIGSGNDTQYPDQVMCTNETFAIDVSAVSGEIQIGGYYQTSRSGGATGKISIANIYLEM